MNTGILSGASAMRASEHRLEAITANLANARATAYKRTATAHHGIAGATPNREAVDIRNRAYLDWSQGPLERTGVPTDVALMGEGFFAVEGPAGEVYTRDGRFALAESGQLVTLEGFPVAWDGARGTLDPVGEAVTIDGAGAVRQGERAVGRLSIVDFESRERLQQGSHGYWQAPPELRPIPAAAEVHQGALEGANVQAIDEMVSLIQTQRAFEAAAEVVRLLSQTYERLNQFR